jgi:hypothetical protein
MKQLKSEKLSVHEGINLVGNPVILKEGRKDCPGQSQNPAPVFPAVERYLQGQVDQIDSCVANVG